MSTRIQTFLKPPITVFTRVRDDGALNQSGERCHNNAVSLSGFTGLVWTESRLVPKGIL